MALNKEIKARRIQLKLSQEYVADQLGISRQAVAKWESGKSRPTAANLAELAALFEMNISELVEPQKFPKDQQIHGKQLKERQRNAKMHVGRIGAVILINAGWDGYSSGLYSDIPHYWLTILGMGLVLLFITSADMNKKHKMEKLQAAVGIIMIFSIFFLPHLLPVSNMWLKYFLSDIATVICISILNLKYWRHIWKAPHIQQEV